MNSNTTFFTLDNIFHMDDYIKIIDLLPFPTLRFETQKYPILEPSRPLITTG